MIMVQMKIKFWVVRQSVRLYIERELLEYYVNKILVVRVLNNRYNNFIFSYEYGCRK